MKYTHFPSVIKLCGSRTIVLILIALVTVPTPVAAQSSGQKKLYKKNVLYYDLDPGGARCGSGVGGDASLTGSNASDQAFNFFIGQGFSDEQAAGIIGNFLAESGMNPKAVEQGAYDGGKKESDTVPPPIGPDGQPGYGIAQWTSPGRKANLERFGKDKVNTLGVQLSFVMEEMKSYGNLKQDLMNIKSGDVVTQSAYLFHRIYEVSNDGIDAITERANKGKGALLAFKAGGGGGSGGGGGTIGGGGTDTTGCSSTAPGDIGANDSLARGELEQKLLSNSHWKPQGANPTNDVKNGIASDDLVRLMLAIMEQLNADIHPSVIKTGHSDCSAGGSTSNHYSGLAVDLGNAGVSPEKMNSIFVWLYQNRASLKIDELIYNPVPSGSKTLDSGVPFAFDSSTMNAHKDHIHVSVNGTKKKAPGCS